MVVTQPPGPLPIINVHSGGPAGVLRPPIKKYPQRPTDHLSNRLRQGSGTAPSFFFPATVLTRPSDAQLSSRKE